MANDHLQRRRESTPSPSGSGLPMSRRELAEAVNQYIWRTTGKQIHLDVDTLRRNEKGKPRWPGTTYRVGLRAVLGVDTDADLGFHPTRRGRTSSTPAVQSIPSTLDRDVTRLLVASTRGSHRLLEDQGGADIGDLESATRRLAVEYLGSPPAPMLHDVLELRGQALHRLKVGDYRPAALRDLLCVIGRLQGVLAYAALDLGAADVAETHAAAGHAVAQRAGDSELTAWTRGTQALIARYSNDFTASERYVRDGLLQRSSGTAGVRLFCGLAQSRAGLGDAAGTHQALQQAEISRENISERDSIGGCSPSPMPSRPTIRPPP
jgi:hypothetical protein